jgi:PKD repeat protein
LAQGVTDRGLGGNAAAPASSTTNGVVQSFDLPTPKVSVRADVKQGKAPLNVTFNGGVVGPLAGNTDVAWDFGDGFGMEDELTVSHVYSRAGTYTVSFTASFDLEGTLLSSTATVVIQVTEDINITPTARITAEFPSEESSLRIDFRSTGGDPDGRIILHEWSFGDGTFASGQQVSHVFPEAATYKVQLTVTDDRGGKATTVRSFDVGLTGFDIKSLPASAQPNPSDTSGSSCGAIGTVNLLLTLLGVTALRGRRPRRRR